MIELTPEILLGALFIFLLRVLNYSISTFRLVMISRGQKVLAACMAFLEALIFIMVMATVITDINDLPRLFAYCMGAAVGSYIGMWMEPRLIKSYSTVTVVASEKGQELANYLRESGYGVTVTYGQGRDGDVTIVRSTINNRETRRFINHVESVNEDAFIEIEQSRTLQRGWVPGGPRRQL
ncbi:MAG: DUF2179 domain-containing protein [Anaerolineae bacterium]|nr:DUF2179 domain-containing protein [Anaerolineae bacterium]MCA9887413.1 DUF2179 domain-containing protein [Anaerolineae bacterium]MCB9458191.1 DUF2179 domain-containing protein [Anaerolineaceae bacterium]